MNIRVRPARVDDVPWLLEQLRAFDQFFGAGRSLFPDPMRARHFLESLIFAHPFHVAVVDEHRAGFIAGALGPHPYNPAIRQLTEMFWWVDPQFRGTRAGSMLLDAFIAEGAERADWIVMTLEHDSPVKDHTLTKRGFKPKERSFLYEVVRPPVVATTFEASGPVLETVPSGAEGRED